MTLKCRELQDIIKQIQHELYTLIKLKELFTAQKQQNEFPACVRQSYNKDYLVTSM